MLHGQAEREAGPPTAEESVGTWFSNPAADHGAAAKRSGVGKYLDINAPPKKVVTGGVAASETPDQANGGPGPPPAKKAKQAAGYGNFGGW